MPRYIVPIAVEVEAIGPSAVDDDRMGDLLMSLPGVVGVETLGVNPATYHDREDSADGPLTIWADVSEAIHA